MSAAVFALPGNEALAARVTEACAGRLGALAIRHFPDGETSLRVLSPVEGCEVVLVATLAQPDAQMAGLHFAASTLRELGARRILLVAPYLPYMRQDWPFASGVGTLARHYARWLGTLVDGLVTVDPHLHRIHALDDIFTIPTDIVAAAPSIAEWLAAQIHEPLLLIGPDSESAQWLAAIAARLGCPQLHLDKQRCGDADVLLRADDLTVHAGRRAVLVDDIVSTAATMIGAVQLLRQQQFIEPVCIAVHALFAGDALQRLQAAGAGTVLSCNTIAHLSNRIDLHPRLAAAAAQMLGSWAGAPDSQPQPQPQPQPASVPR